VVVDYGEAEARDLKLPPPDAPKNPNVVELSVDDKAKRPQADRPQRERPRKPYFEVIE